MKSFWVKINSVSNLGYRLKNPLLYPKGEKNVLKQVGLESSLYLGKKKKSDYRNVNFIIFCHHKLLINNSFCENSLPGLPHMFLPYTLLYLY